MDHHHPFPPPPWGLRALILLHTLALGVLGAYAVLLFLVDAVLQNEVTLRSFLVLGFGAVGCLLVWASVHLSSKNPLRHRGAMILLALTAWITLGLLLAAIPLLFYPLQTPPLRGWFIAFPSFMYALLAGTHALRLARAFRREALGRTRPDSTEHSAPRA